MRAGDAEFVQILNIIQRGQRLIVQARREGANTSLAEEYLSEAKYALKMNKREAAIEYSKKSIYEVVKAKRNQTKQSIQSKDDLKKLTKAELRNLCTQYDLEAIGVKEELVTRIWDHLESTPQQVEDAEPVEEKPGTGPETGEPEEKAPEPRKEPEPEPEIIPEPADWDPGIAIKELTPGLSYLVEEKRPDKLFKLYKQALENDIKGMAISRTNPKILAKRYNIEDSDSIWLTGKEIHGDIRSVLPILEFIMSIIEEFIEETTEGMIIIDGLEYLLTNNKFNSVLRFLRQLVDNVSQTECILLVALSPDALDQTELTLLEKDLLPLNYVE
ncbi:MAG: DUF835 domain-containing protein [Thermoplasmatota archaeon]